MPRFAEHELHGHWVHSHEEDRDDELVFRPASHPFPPARGRTGFDLRGDGTYVERAPGPVDVPEEHPGRWSLEDDNLLLGQEGDRAPQAWRVLELTPERLVLERQG